MHFLPDVYVTCDVCKGKRYDRETLEVRYQDRSIADVLDMTVEEAADLFKAVPSIRDKMETLKRVGLGYIKVGQQATTLSGGEAQRVKLAKELSRRSTGRTLYILDEPTTGLHFHDVAQLLDVLHELVDQGNTMIVIEHNLEVVKTADWIVDMGPEGGDGGGEVVAAGTPEQIARNPKSYTGAVSQAGAGAEGGEAQRGGVVSPRTLVKSPLGLAGPVYPPGLSITADSPSTAAPAKAARRHRGDDDRAGQNVADIAVDIHLGEAVAQHAEDRHARERRRHPRLALLGHRLAEEDGGDRNQHQPRALGRVGGGDAARVHQAAERGPQSRKPEGDETQPPHRHAGEVRRLGVVADCVEQPAENRLFEQRPDGGGGKEGREREVRDGQRAEREAGAGEIRKSAGYRAAEQRPAAGEPESETGIDRHRAERGDERENPDIGDEEPVDEAARHAGRKRGADRKRCRTPAVKTSAATIPARLAIEPTLRSKSPIAITMVIAEATTASMLTCWEMLMRLRAVKNVPGRLSQK